MAGKLFIIELIGSFFIISVWIIMRNIPKIEGVNDTLASVLKALTIGLATLSAITIGNSSDRYQEINIDKPEIKRVTGNLLALGNPTVALMRLIYSY
jgi:F0F1-type ATP synthase membrane subunit c/vacuolar-type H+-ATPase subunit K